MPLGVSSPLRLGIGEVYFGEREKGIDMSTVTEIEAKNHFSELLERVRGGEEVLITSEKDASVRMAPVAEKPRDLEKVRKAVAGLRRIQKEIADDNKGNPVTLAEIKAAIEEGRR